MREVLGFTSDDVKKAQALKRVLKQGDFNIKGDAINWVASLFNWFEGLDMKIEDSIKLLKIEKLANKGPKIKKIGK